MLIASLFEKRAPGLYHNTAAIFDSDGALRGIYRKMHIPDDPLYYEKYYFTPGDLGFKALDTSAGKIGTLVCWDQWYPEGARLTALQGASILFYPTAIGWHPDEKAEFGVAQHDAWRTIQRAHAIANGVYVGVVNRVGFETGNIRGNSAPGKGLEFWGGSFLADPFGRVLAEASHDKEEILLGEIDLKLIEDIRRNWPFLRDRRIDSYAPITSRMIDWKVNRRKSLTKNGPPKLPADRGYRMPAEWGPHASTWLAWPHFRGDWPGKFEPIPWVYAEIIRNLARHERVDLIVKSAKAERKARRGAGEGRGALGQRRVSSLAHGSRLDARFGLHFSYAARGEQARCFADRAAF